MIAAVVLAAGRSKRMGRPKMVLPWGDSTVIGTVVLALDQAGLDRIVIVTGGHRPEVEAALQREYTKATLVSVFNPEYENGDMVRSVSYGLRELDEDVRAAMIVLGDQPQIEGWVIRDLIEAYSETRKKIIIPSYEMHRGHPWVIDRSLWPVLVGGAHTWTMRDFLNSYRDEIDYVVVDTLSVIKDLDTPADYEQQTGQKLSDVDQ